MDLEAPADAWYVFIGVSVVSVAVAGVAFSLPTTPPPDANRAANAIDGAAGSVYNASASYDHDADEVRIDPKRIALRNDGGETEATIAFGEMVPVRSAYATDSQRENLQEVLHGEPVGEVYASNAVFRYTVESIQDDIVNNGPHWQSTRGELTARKIEMGDWNVTLVDA